MNGYIVRRLRGELFNNSCLQIFYMIHQNDIILFTTIVDPGDDRCVMVAMKDEYVLEGTPN